MSAENVELVRRLFETFNRGDYDAVLERYCDPEIEWHSTAEFFDKDVYRGRGELRRFIEGFLTDLDPFWAEADEYIDAGERVVVIGALCGRGKASDVEVKTPRGWVMTVREGKVVRVDTHADLDEARRVARR